MLVPLGAASPSLEGWNFFYYFYFFAIVKIIFLQPWLFARGCKSQITFLQPWRFANAYLVGAPPTAFPKVPLLRFIPHLAPVRLAAP